MKIGLDAHLYFRRRDGGGRVQACLIEALLEEPSPHRYVLLLDARDRGKRLPGVLNRADRLYLNYRIPLVTHLLLLRRKARALGIDILFLQYFSPWKGPPARVVLVHDNLFDSHPQFFTRLERLYLKFVKPSVRKAERVVTPSEFSRRELIRYGYSSAEKIKALIWGVPPDFANLEPGQERTSLVRLKFDLPQRFLLYVGRLNVRKNLLVLLEAFSRIVVRHPVSLVLAGQAQWKNDDLDAAIARLGIASRVRRLGHVPDEDLPCLYALAEAFVYIPIAEGFGLPVLEAMACGTPVVCSAGTAVAEVAGAAGLTVDATDVEAISRVLENIVTDPSLREYCRNAGRVRASELTWTETARKLLAVFDEVAGGGPHG